MKHNLRILLVEDSLLDVCLIEHGLKTAALSFELVQVETADELRRELDASQPDIVLSDHGFPSFDGFTALSIVREKSPDVPFIFVSGSNDPATVFKMYEQGATDYVSKREIQNLSLAVRRALAPQAEAAPILSEPVTREAMFPLTESLPDYFPDPAQLLFCPQCLEARDASGESVQMMDGLRGDREIAFLRQRCVHCQQLAASH